MATARRVFWESIIFLAFLVILAGVVLWSNSRVSRNTAVLAEDHARSAELAQERHSDEIESLRQSWMAESRIRAQGQAAAVAQAFAAGIRTAAAGRWGRYLDSARDALMADPAVSFAHLVTPQGRVITTSDESIEASGRLDEADQWPLSAEALTTRNRAESGLYELALPIVEGDRTVAVLWLGYDLSAVTQAAGSAN